MPGWRDDGRTNVRRSPCLIDVDETSAGAEIAGIVTWLSEKLLLVG